MDIDVIVERKSFDVELEVGNPVVEVKAPDHYNGPFEFAPKHETTIIPIRDKQALDDITLYGDLEWYVPDGWPDIEQLPLTDSCMYYLLDGSLGCKVFYGQTEVGKGTIHAYASLVDSNGNMGPFEEYYSATRTTNSDYWLGVTSYRIPDGVPYVVIKIEFEKAPDSTSHGMQKFMLVSSKTLGTANSGNNHNSNQPIVWIFGKMVDATVQYQNGTAGGDSIYLRRAKLYVGPNFGFGYLFNNVVVDMHSAIINDGDWSSFTNANLTDGNNTGFKQKVVICRDLRRYYNNVWTPTAYGSAYHTKYIDYSGLTDVNGYGIKLNSIFYGWPLLEVLDVSRWNCKVKYIANCFRDLFRVKHLDLSDMDFSECTHFSDNFVNDYALKTLKVNNTWKGAFNLAQSYDFEKGSLLELFDTVPDVRDLDHEAIHATCTFAICPSLYNSLTEEEKAIATNKGWEVKT